MKRMKTLLLVLGLMMSPNLFAQDFESATTAVKNMGVGWNLGNTLDAVNGSKQGLESETCWGQPVTKPELIKMMKEAGFGAIRVPVTWYNHMDANGKVDEAWMKRVHEVVDYVINQGLYCIVNVHHDTGEGSQWLHASMNTYNNVKTKFEYLWRQIAEEFKDYDQHLLFEAYNEMLDDKNTWNEPADKTDGYKAINSYAKSFVTTVRNTGSNNTQRNLVINAYSASSSGDAMKALELPETSGHIAFQIHSYPDWQNESHARELVDNLINTIKTNLSNRAPVIIGEYATLCVWPKLEYYDYNRALALYAMDYFIKKTKEAGIGTFYWMGLSDGTYRSEPAFNQADLAKVLTKAYHGSTFEGIYPEHDSSNGVVAFEGEQQIDWGVPVKIKGSVFSEIGKDAQLELTYKLNFTDYDDIQFLYDGGANGWQKFSGGIYADGTKLDGADFSASNFYTASTGSTHTTKFTFDEGVLTLITQKDLILQGHGVIVNKAVVSSKDNAASILSPKVVQTTDAIYNLNGQRVTNLQKGIYIQNGKKMIIK